MAPNFALWDRIVEWHGVESSILDLVDRPEFVHALMKRFTDAHMSMLDQLEEQGLLAYDLPTIHCTGAYTDDLPSAGTDDVTCMALMTASGSDSLNEIRSELIASM